MASLQVREISCALTVALKERYPKMDWRGIWARCALLLSAPELVCDPNASVDEIVAEIMQYDRQ